MAAPARRQSVARAGLLAGMALVLGWAAAACDLANPAAASGYVPSRLPVGPLAIAAWLPAGLGAEVRLEAPDRQRLRDLGLTQLEWLQRAEQDGRTAEMLAMEFCRESGLRLPVYYEPRGYSPYDKLRNWASRERLGAGYDDSLRVLVADLVAQWRGDPALAGYLVGHEDYHWQAYPALGHALARLRELDPLRPAFAVGSIDSYPRREQFLDAFFAEDGPANVFQHEHYVFRAAVPDSGAGVRQRLHELAEGYGRAARAVQDRNGRWHAIVQAHGETRAGAVHYRQPRAGELRAQVGLALARGAAGVVYFLYSSGEEQVRDSGGAVREVRHYQGLVDDGGQPTALYEAARRINADLGRLSPALESLHFHGGYRGDRLPSGAPVTGADGDLELGLFGDGETVTHLLVANCRTWAERRARLHLPGRGLRDAVSGQDLGQDEVDVDLEAGGFRLLRLEPGRGAAEP